MNEDANDATESFFERMLERSRETLDIDSEFRYDGHVTPEQLRQRYDRGDIVRALVDARPDATWSGDHRLTLDGRPSALLNEIARRYRLWNAFFRADLMADITGYSVIVLPGTDTEQPPTAQEAETFRLAVYGAEKITFDNADVAADGMPTRYRLAGSLRYINGLRCLHVVDGRYSTSTLVGNPRIISAWNRIADWQKTVGGGAEAFMQGALPKYHLSYDKMPSAQEREGVRSRMKRFILGRLRWLATSSQTIEQISPTPVDYAMNGEFGMMVLATAFRVPLSQVTHEASSLASAVVARTAWHDIVDEHRNEHAEPNIISRGVAWFDSIRAGQGGVTNLAAESRVGVEWEPWSEIEATGSEPSEPAGESEAA